MPLNGQLYNNLILVKYLKWNNNDCQIYKKVGCGTANGCYYNAVVKYLAFIPMVYQLK